MKILKTQRPPKLNFWGRCVFGFFIFQNFKNTFDYLTAAYFWGQNPIFIFRPTFLIHWSCETTSVLHVWKGFLSYFMMDQLRKHSEVHFVMLEHTLWQANTSYSGVTWVLSFIQIPFYWNFSKGWKQSSWPCIPPWNLLCIFFLVYSAWKCELRSGYFEFR